MDKSSETMKKADQAIEQAKAQLDASTKKEKEFTEQLKALAEKNNLTVPAFTSIGK
ncbi:DUF4471 domain-containing protein [Heliomicrobium gestii]|nr:DUF4471 domain-containing protein [Heliomicrobium gestii]